MEEAALLAIKAIDMGVDAFILQDLGLARILKELSPNIVLHASTQTAALSLEAVKALAELGFTRVIGPREWSLVEIADICASVKPLEIEVFIHGALCWGISGQCLFSEDLTGRSANRGDCAGPCRTNFTSAGEEGYFFSMKDLERGPDILKLRSMGVASAKIEGRMKDPDTIRSIVAHYRALLDTGKEPLKKVSFSRAVVKEPSTPKHEVTNSEWPGTWGVPLGTVQESVNGAFTLKLLEPLSLHDGILIKTGDGWTPVGVVSLEPGPKAEKGQKVRIGTTKTPLDKSEARLIRGHDSKVRELSPEAYPKRLPAVKMSASWLEAGLLLKELEFGFEHFFPVTVEPGKSDPLKPLAFLETHSNSEVLWTQTLPEGWPGAFAPPSLLKDISRTWWDKYWEYRENAEKKKIRRIIEQDANISLPELPEGLSVFSWDQDSWVGGKWLLNEPVHGAVMLLNIGHCWHVRELLNNSDPIPALVLGRLLYPVNKSVLAVWQEFFKAFHLPIYRGTKRNTVPTMVARHCFRLSRYGNCKECPGTWDMTVEQNGKKWRVFGDCTRSVLEKR